MSWACDMPEELLCRPVGLIVLTGLDLIYNAVHKAIWDSFSNNRRADRVPLKFCSYGIDHEYPKCRAKRTSYEWYIPKGILKSSWMNKHLDQIPAVVVIFFDLDWDEAMWKERQMECATRVEIVRNSLLGRGTKVCMVLVQKNAPLPPGEDVIAGERAATLCSACELSGKSLFVLPITDHLLGYTIRLENAFFELSQTYYHTEARRVKSHKDFLNKTTHQLLFVRHQFKIAFFNELKQDPHTALKHYKQAYTHVLELRISDTNLLEAKTIAGFINYKICRLSFQGNTPLDAIAQFRKHIDFFKAKVGYPDLSFEHSAWMAKQFQVFGDLFDEAIKLGGLTAIQTQHPGFYYQQSAHHSLSRKQTVAKLQLPPDLLDLNSSADVLEHLSTLDYYGQRPWRQGIQSIEVPDPAREREGINALQALEAKVDHSWIIIPLLGSAVAQFKKYKSPRMKRWLMVQMGEEYFHAKDYGRAMALLSRVTWEYRHERWWCLLTSVLITQLKCAYLMANLQDYITVCLELVGCYCDNSPEDKERIFKNLLCLLSGSSPDPELDYACDSARSTAWINSLTAGDGEVLTVEMTNMASFIECKAQFASESFSADEPVVVFVYLKSSAPAAVKFSKLYVTFSNPFYNTSCLLSVDIVVEPGQIKQHNFSFVSHIDDIGKVIDIKSVCLEWSGGLQRPVCLHWSGPGGDIIAPLQQTASRSNVDPWNEIVVRPSARLLFRSASALDIDVKHRPPALVNEKCHYSVTVTNNEQTTITDIVISFAFKDMSANQNVTTISTEEGEQMNESTLESKQQLIRNYFSQTVKPADLILVVTVSYKITVYIDNTPIVCHCHAEQNVCHSVVEPLGFDFQTFNLQFEKSDFITTNSPFVLLTDIRSLTAWPLRLTSSRLELSDAVTDVSSNGNDHSQLSNVFIKSEADHVGECFVLNIDGSLPSLQSADNVFLGHYVISLQRVDCPTENFEITVKLPSVRITSLPISLQLSLPTDVSVESQLSLRYSLQNNTDLMHDVDISVDSSEAFMFAGHRQVHVRLQPRSVYQLTYNLVPLVCGNVNLPKLHLNLSRYPSFDALSAEIYRMIPSTVFVLPRKRSMANVECKEQLVH